MDSITDLTYKRFKSEIDKKDITLVLKMVKSINTI